MNMFVYICLWVFVIYSLLGWVTEVIYTAIERGHFTNRGFLNGPYCPIYGSGVLVVILILEPIHHHLLLVFLGSVLLTTLIEFITGFVMEKIFHNKWWDYSMVPFNIMGYVCLKSSVIWGLACMLIVTVVHPFIEKLIGIIPVAVGVFLLILSLACLLTDFIVTVSTIMKFNRRLILMDEIAQRLKNLSNEMGITIFENVQGAVDKKNKFAEDHEDLINDFTQKKDKFTSNVENTYEKINSSVKQRIKSELLEEKKLEYEKLIGKYKELVEKRTYGQNRLLKAFPEMKSLRNNESLQKIKQELQKYRKDK